MSKDRQQEVLTVEAHLLLPVEPPEVVPPILESEIVQLPSEKSLLEVAVVDTPDPAPRPAAVPETPMETWALRVPVLPLCKVAEDHRPRAALQEYHQ